MAATQEISKQEHNPRLLSSMSLAFVGDAVYELMAREYIAAAGSLPPGKLHKRTVELVRASFQARAYDLLAERLSEDEADILRRGRNSSAVHPPRNADMLEYRKATGMEALFGYLYLCGRIDRLNELFAAIVDKLIAAPIHGETL